MRGRMRGLHVTRWYSVLAPSITTAEPAKTAAPTRRSPSVALTKTAPMMQAATKPAACSVPRIRGLTRGRSTAMPVVSIASLLSPNGGSRRGWAASTAPQRPTRVHSVAQVRPGPAEATMDADRSCIPRAEGSPGVTGKRTQAAVHAPLELSALREGVEALSGAHGMSALQPADLWGDRPAPQVLTAPRGGTWARRDRRRWPSAHASWR